MTSEKDDWQSTQSSVLERMSHLFNNYDMSDITFLVKECRIPAHRFILAASSSVFNAMFNGPMAETKREIEISDCENSECLLEFLKFIYTDSIDLTCDNALNILYLSKKYMIPVLSSRCCDFISKFLTRENIFAILQQSVKLDEPKLISRCLEFTEPVISQIIELESFLSLDFDTLKFILQDDGLQIPEINLFLAVEKWCNRKITDSTESRRKILSDAMHLIRFPCMTSEEFAEHCMFSGLLTMEEIRDISYLKILPSGSHASEIKARMPFSMKKRATCPKMFSLNLIACGHQGQPWSYSGLEDALNFTVNKRISLCGVSLFGDPNLHHIGLSLKAGSCNLTLSFPNFFL